MTTGEAEQLISWLVGFDAYAALTFFAARTDNSLRERRKTVQDGGFILSATLPLHDVSGAENCGGQYNCTSAPAHNADRAVI